MSVLCLASSILNPLLSVYIQKGMPFLKIFVQNLQLAHWLQDLNKIMPKHLQKQNSLIIMESTLFIQLTCILCVTTNPLMSGGNRRSYILKPVDLFKYV